MRVTDPDEIRLQKDLKKKVRECMMKHSAYRPDGKINPAAGRDHPLLYARGLVSFADRVGCTHRNIQLWLNEPDRCVRPALRMAIEAELRRAEEADKRGAEGDDEDALISRLARATGKDPVVLRNVFRALPSVA